jgi:hypothetical protein
MKNLTFVNDSRIKEVLRSVAEQNLDEGEAEVFYPMSSVVVT